LLVLAERERRNLNLPISRSVLMIITTTVACCPRLLKLDSTEGAEL
jgi:hypothetical protein